MFRIANNIISLQTWRKKKNNLEKMPPPIEQGRLAKKGKVLETAEATDLLIKKITNQENSKARAFSNNRLLSYVQEEITLLQVDDKNMQKTASLLQGMREIFLSLGEGESSVDLNLDRTDAPVGSLRISNSLRQLEAAISRISRQRANLEGRINNLKQTVELLYLGGENPADGSGSPSGNAEKDVGGIWESLGVVKEQIQRENSMAVMAQTNFQQQRVLRLLEDER